MARTLTVLRKETSSASLSPSAILTGGGGELAPQSLPDDQRVDRSPLRSQLSIHSNLNSPVYGGQMAIAGFLDCMCLALWASGLWLRYAALQNLIPSFPWIAHPRPAPWRNPRKGRDHILPSGNTAPVQ